MRAVILKLISLVLICLLLFSICGQPGSLQIMRSASAAGFTSSVRLTGKARLRTPTIPYKTITPILKTTEPPIEDTPEPAITPEKDIYNSSNTSDRVNLSLTDTSMQTEDSLEPSSYSAGEIHDITYLIEETDIKETFEPVSMVTGSETDHAVTAESQKTIQSALNSDWFHDLIQRVSSYRSILFPETEHAMNIAERLHHIWGKAPELIICPIAFVCIIAICISSRKRRKKKSEDKDEKLVVHNKSDEPPRSEPEKRKNAEDRAAAPVSSVSVEKKPSENNLVRIQTVSAPETKTDTINAKGKAQIQSPKEPSRVNTIQLDAALIHRLEKESQEVNSLLVVSYEPEEYESSVAIENKADDNHFEDHDNSPETAETVPGVKATDHSLSEQDEKQNVNAESITNASTNFKPSEERKATVEKTSGQSFTPSPSVTSSGGFVLDLERLAKLAAETDDVQNMLIEDLAQTDDLDDEEQGNSPELSEDNTLEDEGDQENPDTQLLHADELDDEWREFFKNVDIKALKAFMQGETSFRKYCKEVGRMPDQVIDEINECALSDDSIGDCLISDGEIYEDYLQELEKQLGG